MKLEELTCSIAKDSPGTFRTNSSRAKAYWDRSELPPH